MACGSRRTPSPRLGKTSGKAVGLTLLPSQTLIRRFGLFNEMFGVSGALPARSGQHRWAPPPGQCRTEPLPLPPAPICRLLLSLADFELLRRIGDGSYSHVVLARHRETGQEYALKVVDKQYILR